MSKAKLIAIPLILVVALIVAVRWRRPAATPTPESASRPSARRTATAPESPLGSVGDSRPIQRAAGDPAPKIGDQPPVQKPPADPPDDDTLYPGHASLIAMKDWAGFYRQTRGCNPFELSDLIIRRLGVELQLTDAQCLRIQELLRQEQDDAAREILAKYGKNTLSGVFTVPVEQRATQKELWDGLLALGEEVRKRFDATFAESFDAPKMAAINQHLRNRNFTLCSGFMKRYGDDKLGMDASRDDTIRLVRVGALDFGYSSFFDGQVGIQTAAPPK
jgi:hypothetical protein